ncbi:anthraniloyl-CoA monooxygenase [Murinocardiopsis flavida]|uniref:Anthraniloyl-CoA monooxygenase n=1 Tax=Murinocardiopsis flavida TaxID=645275 RepID=A0A2P8DSS8_9ACTN|nr:bifunctional salicylyl-CoA 5-hydroxylase/oxidoreductase [Murinocardiopsis flavida]PSL00268.1 anthraniloyl-CoA monooxygenase [Murinocardiopsis flavida]
MRIACIGGGPGGLYFAALMKQLDPRHEVTVYERNAVGDTFGFGVVLSDETLGGIEHADPEVYAELSRAFARWDDIDIHYAGQVVTSGGHGFSAVDRRTLLRILHDRCRDLGVDLRFGTEAPPADALAPHHDLVVAADGVNSATRTAHAADFGTDLERRHCTYIWFGTDLVFDAFKFHIVDTPHGVMQVHGYPYSATRSTFIAEMHERVWSAAGLDTADPVAACEKLFADVLGGHRLIADNPRWIAFTTVRNRTWRRGNVVLLGDAAHTAHFSIGSGTKLAMEDALALAACLHEDSGGGVAAALAAYEEERRPVVASTQRAAQASLEWFEDIGRYRAQPPEQFAFNILTRSRRVTYDNLRLRDPEFVERADAWFARHAGGAPAEPRPPMFHPFRLRGLELRNRVVVSAMDMYSAQDGVPGDFHLVHLGSKALGGAALVMTEMVCVSPTGRITPGCTGLYTDGQRDAWQRIVAFAHEHGEAAIGVQLGHSGRKGSTRLMWEGMDEPLADGNWPVVAPSALPYKEGVNQVPHALDTAELAAITEEFAAAARRARDAGFDLLELHCAHGYLLSSFLSPVTNLRTDRYGGDLGARLRYPLEVFAAVRAEWPAERPMTVRISATDWVADGTTGEDAVRIARAFAAAGADAIDVSTGQVTPDERPAYGRSYQTPFADRIRAEAGVPVIAVGAISSHDDVNSLILAGRADLCALGRPHLYDPQWTLHAAAEQGYSGPGASWPVPYRAGSRRPQTGRADDPRPRLDIVRGDDRRTAHRRWRP